MKKSGSMPLGALALLILVIGAVISFFEWNAGVLVMLASVGAVCIARYYSASPGFAGSLALIPAILIFVYIYGSIDREAPLFALNISPTVRTIVIAGCLLFVAGLWLGGKSGDAEPIGSRCNFSASSFFFAIGVVALILSAINYATGDIAVLAEDIDSARFSGNFGVFGHLWSLIHPVTQVSVLIALLKLQQRRLDARWTVLAVLSLGSLALTGGRSLVAIPFIAFGVLYLELRRPKLQAVLVVVVVGLLVFGAVGQARTSSLPTSAETRVSYAGGPKGWFDAIDASLQTGPRVLTLAIDRLQGKTFGGQFIIGDLPYVRSASTVGSDRMVTELLGRNPNAVGGLPPTIFGGFYLDFAWLGVIVGAVAIGVLLAVSRRLVYREPSLSTLVWFGYLAAYIGISGYSYVSFRPSWIVVLLMCVAAAFLSREIDGSGAGRVEVPAVSRRSRTTHL